MDTSLLIPTQDDFRLSFQEIQEMWQFVKNGGIFTKEAMKLHDPNRSSPIVLLKIIEDPDVTYIRDGLHRSCIIHLAGRSLHSKEYIVERRTYDQMMSINLECGWVTPHDPRTEVRHAGFHDFKYEILNKIKNGEDSEEIKKYILQNKHRFCSRREVKHTLLEFFVRRLIRSQIKENNL